MTIRMLPREVLLMLTDRFYAKAAFSQKKAFNNVSAIPGVEAAGALVVRSQDLVVAQKNVKQFTARSR